jgi:hypothetical protein
VVVIFATLNGHIMNTLETETREHLSNSKGDDLEYTIAKYRAFGWSILNVEWEFSDNPEESGVGSRWKAKFWRIKNDAGLNGPDGILD